MALTIAVWKPTSSREWYADRRKRFRWFLPCLLLLFTPLFLFLSVANGWVPRHPYGDQLEQAMMLLQIPLYAVYLYGFFVGMFTPLSVLSGKVRKPKKGEPLGSIPVMIMLKTNSQTSIDEGLLDFKDGKLCFDGKFTNFAFGRQRVSWVHLFDLPSTFSRRIWLTCEAGAIGIIIFAPPSWDARRWFRHDLNRRFAYWDVSRLPTEDDVLMPVTPDPTQCEIRTQAWKWFATVTVMMALAFAVELQLSHGFSFWSINFVSVSEEFTAAALFVGVLVTIAGAFQWLAMKRDERRFAAPQA